MDDLIRIQDSTHFHEVFWIKQTIIRDGFWFGTTTSEVFNDFDAKIKRKVGIVMRNDVYMSVYFISDDVEYTALQI